MTNFDKQTISLIQKAQARQAEVLELDYEPNLKVVDLADLSEPGYNTRKLVPSQLRVIIDSLVEYGFLGGIFVNAATNKVVDGWHRLELWRQIGNDTIPVHYLHFQSSKQEREAHLRLNSVLATFSPEDFGLSFDNIDMLEFGFTEAEVKTYDDAAINIEKNKAAKQPEVEGYKKLTTTIKSGHFKKLQAFKKTMNVPHVADVIENLIQFYENH